MVCLVEGKKGKHEIWEAKTNDILAARNAGAFKQALDELQALPAEGKLRRSLMRISAGNKKSPT